MESLSSRPTINRPSTHGNDGERRCHRSKFHMKCKDRFLKDPRYRQSREEHGWDQAKCEEIEQNGTRRSLLHAYEVRTIAVFIKLEPPAKKFRKKCSGGRSI